MNTEQFNRRAEAIQAQLEIFRLRIWAGLGTVLALSALAGSLMLAEQHMKIQDLRAQEARVTWKQ